MDGRLNTEKLDYFVMRTRIHGEQKGNIVVNIIRLWENKWKKKGIAWYECNDGNYEQGFFFYNMNNCDKM